jgi:hypothetical protein
MKQGSAATRRRTPIEDAYDQFRLERQGNRLSPRTLASYGYHLDGFFTWLRREHPHHAARPARPAARRGDVAGHSTTCATGVAGRSSARFRRYVLGAAPLQGHQAAFGMVPAA